MTHGHLMNEFALLRSRQRALRIAMRLFEHITDQKLLIEIGETLDKSASSPDKEEVEHALQRLIALAKEFDIPTS